MQTWRPTWQTPRQLSIVQVDATSPLFPLSLSNPLHPPLSLSRRRRPRDFPTSANRDSPAANRATVSAYKSEIDIINVVEHRIWQSMEEGQFENLPGKGKPLNSSTNPHADPAEDTLYRILSKSGRAPEWVELNKEIRNRISKWRSILKKAWEIRCSGDQSKWVQNSEALKVQLHDINDKVFRYNLIVPFGRQMSGLKWDKELSCIE